MTVTLDTERQYSLSTDFLTVGFADLTSAVACPLADIPIGAVVVGGEVVVDTVFNSATSDVLDVGDGVDDDRYTASQVDLTALGRTAFTLTGFEYTANDTIDAIWTGVGAAPSTGSFRVRFEYVIQGRGNENQG